MKKWCIPLIAAPLLLVGCQKTGSLGGTSWTVLEVLSTDETDIVDMDIEFGTNGMVTTDTTRADGSTDKARRPYSVHDALITVKRDTGDLNVLHSINGEEMTLTGETFQARLLRLD